MQAKSSPAHRTASALRSAGVGVGRVEWVNGRLQTASWLMGLIKEVDGEQP